MNNPTCAGCQTVVGCQANPVACPNLVNPRPGPEDFGIPAAYAVYAENYANWKASEQPVFHLRQYGDVTAAQLDEAIARPKDKP